MTRIGNAIAHVCNQAHIQMTKSLPQNRIPCRYEKEKFYTQFLDLGKILKILMVKTFLPRTADILNHLKLTPLIIKKLNLYMCIICLSHMVRMDIKKSPSQFS